MSAPPAQTALFSQFCQSVEFHVKEKVPGAHVCHRLLEICASPGIQNLNDTSILLNVDMLRAVFLVTSIAFDVTLNVIC